MGSQHWGCCHKEKGKDAWLSAVRTHLRFHDFSVSRLIAIFHMLSLWCVIICGKYTRRRKVATSQFQGNSSQYICHKAEKNILFLKAMGGFSKASRCPMEPWILPWAITFHRNPRLEQFIVIEVGCNKATDALMLTRLFTQKESVDMISWLKETRFRRFFCPLDWGLWKKIVQLNLRGVQEYHHFCLEPVHENFQQVSAAAQKFGLDRAGLHVHQLALSSSDVPPTVEFPHAAKGQETIGIDVGARRGATYEVNVTTLDKFVQKEKIKEVNILKIDTEGNDARVLLGAIQTLTSLKPEYLTFENHNIGHWSRFDLKDVVDFLDNIFYTCFWATRRGTLVRLTGCWDDKYSTMKGHSNVACYHRSSRELRKLMEQWCLDEEADL